MPSQNVYLGSLVKGSFEGNGTLTLKDGTKKSGTWKNNQLVKTVKGDKVNYVADVITIPKVMRIIPKEELDLIKIFTDEPQVNDDTTLLDQWKKAGPF